MLVWLWFAAVTPALAWPAPLYDARYRKDASYRRAARRAPLAAAMALAR
jgi:hypothetical protein